MTVAIARFDISASELREAAAGTGDARAARRMLAIALVLDGWSRDAAAEACAMDRQTLRDWVHRYNESGPDGLFDLPRRNGPLPRLSDEQQAKVAEWVEQGPTLERDGVVRWRCVDLQQRIEAEFAIRLHERRVGKLLRKLLFRRLSVRPQHPQSKPECCCPCHPTPELNPVENVWEFLRGNLLSHRVWRATMHSRSLS